MGGVATSEAKLERCLELEPPYPGRPGLASYKNAGKLKDVGMPRYFATLFFAPLALLGQVSGGIVVDQPRAIIMDENGTVVSTIRSQAPTPVQAPAQQYKPEDMGTVSGTVVNALTGEPVRRATLRLAGRDVPGDASATSDASGRFTIRDVRPGNYRLTASHSSFSSAPYSAAGNPRTPATITVARAQNVVDLALRLTPNGVIAGRVVDENDDPLAYAQVRILQRRYQQGRRLLQFAGSSATTNDLGEYRLFDVAPGRYYLNAVPRREGPVSTKEAEDFVPTYYPGATDPAAAAPLEVAAGAQLRDINLRLRRQRIVRVRGRVVDGVNASGRQPNYVVMLMPRDAPGAEARGTATDRQGAFEISPVTPGSYYLAATVSQSNRPSYMIRQPLEVGSSDVNDVVVSIQPPASVNGRLKVDGATTTKLTALRVNLTPQDTGVSAPQNARVTEDLTFAVNNMAPERYYVSVAGLPDGFYLKSVRAGGAEALNLGVDLTGGGVGQLELTLSPNAGQVAGFVRDDKTQQPAPGATVTLVPAEPDRRLRDTFYRTTVANESGAFAFRSVTPGQYRVYAWEQIENGAYLDPEFVRPLESMGDAVTVGENDRQTVQVKLIPAESVAQK
jgi:protocatechuate 3,4-dioxygenase beta subunit